MIRELYLWSFLATKTLKEIVVVFLLWSLSLHLYRGELTEEWYM